MPKTGRYSGHSLVTVFEAANDTNRELYVGLTDLLVNSLISSHAERFPPEISHWRKEQRISYHCIEYAMVRSDAWDFIKTYARSSALKGWKVIRARA